MTLQRFAASAAQNAACDDVLLFSSSARRAFRVMRGCSVEEVARPAAATDAKEPVAGFDAVSMELTSIRRTPDSPLGELSLDSVLDSAGPSESLVSTADDVTAGELGSLALVGTSTLGPCFLAPLGPWATLIVSPSLSVPELAGADFVELVVLLLAPAELPFFFLGTLEDGAVASFMVLLGAAAPTLLDGIFPALVGVANRTTLSWVFVGFGFSSSAIFESAC